VPDSSQPAGNSRKAHGPAPPWLRLASVCVVLIAVPVGLYLFLYQRSRIEDATIRNFRALDAAAVRVDQVLRRLSAVVESSSFGIPPDMLNEVTDRLTDHAPACGGERGFRGGRPRPSAWSARIIQLSDADLRAERPRRKPS